MVKNWPANAGLDPDYLLKGMATHSSNLAWVKPIDRGAWGATVLTVVHGRTGLKHTLILGKGICRERGSLMISFILDSVPGGLTVASVTKHQVGSHFWGPDLTFNYVVV